MRETTLLLIFYVVIGCVIFVAGIAMLLAARFLISRHIARKPKDGDVDFDEWYNQYAEKLVERLSAEEVRAKLYPIRKPEGSTSIVRF